MKSYIDRLKECPIEKLEDGLKEAKARFAMAERDAATIEHVLRERRESQCSPTGR